jgi:hypothetical protein
MAILATTSKTRATREYSIHTLMNDASAANTLSDEFEALDMETVTLVVESSAGVSSGAVVLEGAALAAYTGTWATLATLTINAATKVFAATINLSTSAGLPMPRIRARISTIIGGGTIDAYLAVRK